MTQHYKQQSWTERTGYGAQTGAPDDDVQAALRRNGFHNAQTSLGSMGILGHWVVLPAVRIRAYPARLPA